MIFTVRYHKQYTQKNLYYARHKTFFPYSLIARVGFSLQLLCCYVFPLCYWEFFCWYVFSVRFSGYNTRKCLFCFTMIFSLSCSTIFTQTIDFKLYIFNIFFIVWKIYIKISPRRLSPFFSQNVCVSTLTHSVFLSKSFSLFLTYNCFYRSFFILPIHFVSSLQPPTSPRWARLLRVLLLWMLKNRTHSSNRAAEWRSCEMNSALTGRMANELTIILSALSLFWGADEWSRWRESNYFSRQ